MKKIYITLLTLCVAAAAYAQLPEKFTPDQKLRAAEAIIENFYVEDVNSDTIVSEAIIAMLKTLDPHSAYSTPQETKEFTEPLQGKFSGIGIQFNMLEDTVYVIQTVAGGPSEKVGILAGDRIISANDTVIAGKKMVNTQIMKKLRGPKGSTVDLKVKRGDEIIDFAVVRDDIPLYSVDETFMADPQTGYIRITRFAEDTANEVRDAMKKLKKQGMKNLILDVSGSIRPCVGVPTQRHACGEHRRPQCQAFRLRDRGSGRFPRRPLGGYCRSVVGVGIRNPLGSTPGQ